MAEYPLTGKAEPSGFRKFIRADKTQRALLIISFMFVPLALLLMFTYIPFGKMVQFSFYNRNYLSEGTFVGLACAMASSCWSSSSCARWPRRSSSSTSSRTTRKTPS